MNFEIGRKILTLLTFGCPNYHMLWHYWKTAESSTNGMLGVACGS